MMSEAVVCESTTAVAGARIPQTSIVGGNKPLHRFIRGEPKCVGIVLLFLGGCLFILGIPMRLEGILHTSADSLTPFWLGLLFIICGILFILTEHSPSKKMVTASLALSIISILAVIVAFFQFLHSILLNEYHMSPGPRSIVHSLEAVFLVHSLVGGVILIVMTALSRAALHSSKTQAVVVMHNLPSPVREDASISL